MNTYDFDKTIYINDSSADFYKWCLKRYPKAVMPTVPRTLLKALLYAVKKIKTKELKEQVFSFLRNLENVDELVEKFWQEKKQGIGQWYLEQKRDDDIIISASPEFLLLPIVRELGVSLIATPMDKTNGRIVGENCHDDEKVRRFYEEFPQSHTEEFYSDSLSDTPMARIADRAFLVNRGSLGPWPEKYLK